MDIVWDDDHAFIDVAVMLFTAGGGFALVDKELHFSVEEEQIDPGVCERILLCLRHIGIRPD
jgi:hypothetical protein